jgi:hypothetical protein
LCLFLDRFCAASFLLLCRVCFRRAQLLPLFQSQTIDLSIELEDFHLFCHRMHILYVVERTVLFSQPRHWHNVSGQKLPKDYSLSLIDAIIGCFFRF